jgi:signal transduction histidine kinase
VIAVVEDDAAGTLVEDTAAVSDDPRIDAVEAVSAAVAQARETASQRGIDIAYAYAGQPVWVRADEAELRRALDELLSGAVESATLGSLAVRCAPSDGDALLEILEVRHPDAAGTDLAALFDDRLAGEAPDEPPPPPVSGELTTLLTLVQSHHGILGVSSSPDAGSRITVRLPLARG